MITATATPRVVAYRRFLGILLPIIRYHERLDALLFVV
jgi:hypothetical protein